MSIEMRRDLIALLVVIVGLIPRGFQQETWKVNEKTQGVECPTWFVPQSNHTGDCKCGVGTFSSLVTVKCDEDLNQSMLISGTCMTYSESIDVTVVGGCPYNSHKSDSQELYVILPQNVSHLNEFMCGGLDRSGPLCSHCKDGLGIPVFSYTLHCIPCLGSFGGWLLYIFLALFPTTIFFLIVIIFQVRVTSAPMNVFIYVCQVLSYITNSQPFPEYVTIHSLCNNCTLYLLWILEFGLLSFGFSFLLCQ